MSAFQKKTRVLSKTLRWSDIVWLFLLIIGTIGQSVGQSPGGGTPRAILRDCQAYAEEQLGKDAVVVRVGHLTRPEVWEAVLAVPIHARTREKPESLLISKGAIVELVDGKWHVVLDIGATVSNTHGTILAIDVPSFRGLRVMIDQRRGDDQLGFTIYLKYLEADLQPEEGIDTAISWNPSAGRYQEFAYYEEPMHFVNEKPFAEP